MSKSLQFIANDVPVEWRAAVDSIRLPDESDPSPAQTSFTPSPSLPDILSDDPYFRPSSVPLDKKSALLKSADSFCADLSRCRAMLQSAELKRREISASIELIHGECDSQILAEQRLSVFVKSIESILRYFDDLDKISLDFRSPMFTVHSPDFSSNLAKIERGIQFFQVNQNYKDAKRNLDKYLRLQDRAVEIICNHVSSTLEKITNRLINNQKMDESIYVKFISVAPTIRRLFELSEKTKAFGSVLEIYKNSRVNLLNPLITQPLQNPNDIRSRASTVLTFSRKEYELAKEFFNFNGHPMYIKCFCELINDIGKCFYNVCCSLLGNIGTTIKGNEIKMLCDICIVLKGDVLQDEISRIPLASDKLRFQFQRVLLEAQERLVVKAETHMNNNIKSDTLKTIELLSLLYYALIRETFSRSSYNILSIYMKSTEESSKKIKNALEKDIYLLENYLLIQDCINGFDCQIIPSSTTEKSQPQINNTPSSSELFWGLVRLDKNVIKNVNDAISRKVMNSNSQTKIILDTSINIKNEIESIVNKCYISLTKHISEIFLKPVLEITSKDGQSIPQSILMLKQMEKELIENTKTNGFSKISAQIQNQKTKRQILSALKSKLKTSISEEPNITDQEIINLLSNIIEKIDL